MELLSLKEIAQACGGSFNNDCEINGVCIDTRKITKGCLFICIKGERFDAHQFAQEALDKGAGAVMIHKDISKISGIVQSTSATAEESAAASEELSGQALTLKSLVDGFVLKKNL